MMNNLDDLIKEVDKKIKIDERFKYIDDVEEYFSNKIIDKIDRIFARVLDSESALVRSQFISGTHALTVTLFGLLRPGDLLLSITGKPYDTMDEVIGIKDNNSSLKSFGIKFDYIDLVDNNFDYNKIEDYLKNNKVKVIEIQRSRGYADRNSISVEDLEKIVKFIKNIDNEIIIIMNNMM